MRIYGAATFILAGVLLGLGAVSHAAENADPYDRAGRLGLGVSMQTSTSVGPGLRYWFTNRVGADVGGSFQIERNGSEPHDNYVINGSLLYLIKQKGGLRFEGLFTAGYERDIEYFNDEEFGFQEVQTRKEPFVGVGVGVEYAFQEIPDLSFGATLTGLGIRWISETTNSTFDDGIPFENSESKTIRYMSDPDVSLTLRYYF
jgi:hypothetical protein